MSEAELERLLILSAAMGIIYLIGLLFFGVPFWKAAIVSFGICCLVITGWGARWIIRSAVAILALMALVWIEFLPHPKSWKAEASALITMSCNGSLDACRSQCLSGNRASERP